MRRNSLSILGSLSRRIAESKRLATDAPSVFAVRKLSTPASLDDILIITNSCSKRIKQLQDKSNDKSLFLRISVQGGGCSGFQYNFDMDRTIAADDDRIFTKDGTQVVVDSGSYELIKGSTVDYMQEMIKSAFAVVNNPQSESACGCGSSFAVKNFSTNPALD